MNTLLYRKVIALMLSVYVCTTLVVHWNVAPLAHGKAATVFSMALAILAGAVILNLILKSVAATLSLIVLLGFVSFLSALVLALTFALIGPLLSRDDSVDSYNPCGTWGDDEDYGSKISSEPIDPTTNLQAGVIWGEPLNR